ncbi:MAG: hypothetical protein HKP58_13225 [Desulfatitalea sp.]|nr:hypothetical protein [Desulfatitalea sp.]NNK01361.1 hypothetical protein [Desulfatitalea sp.]
MKKRFILISLILALTACSGGDDGGQGQGATNGITALSLDRTVEGTIAVEGEVDWYEYTAVEANRNLNIVCEGTWVDSPVEFMVTAYDVDAAGNLTPIIGRSATENAMTPASLKLRVGIQGRRTLRIAVRDFKDDDASDRIPYRLRVSYEQTQGSVGNNNFANAVTLTVGEVPPHCTYDVIADATEVNFHTFTVATGGVYQVTAAFEVPITPTRFNLGVELYDGSGNLVHRFDGPRPIGHLYTILTYLAPGNYNIATYDQGRDETFEGEYALYVVPVAAQEPHLNDTIDAAQTVAPDVSDVYVMDGSLEYIQDQDWYHIDIPEDSGANSYNMRVSFERGFDEVPENIGNSSIIPEYRVAVRDAAGAVIHEFDRSVNADGTYDVEVGRAPGNAHYLTVTPIFRYQLADALPYRLRVTLQVVSDPNESPTPIALTGPYLQQVTGKIFKIGDVDDYTVSVDATTGSKILEVYFETAEASDVEYVVNVNYDNKHRVLRDQYGTAATREGGVNYKASYFFAAGTTTAVALQVGDDQRNSGSQVDYTLGVNIVDVPAAGPAASGPVSSPVYFGEADEQAATTDITEVQVYEFNDHNRQPTIKANTALLQVGTLTANRWESPWISGYVDYDGDRDIFELNFDQVPKGDQYYFDIQVHMFTPGSQVEYAWVLFRDGGPEPNNRLLERTFWSDSASVAYDYEYDQNGEGVVAAYADNDTTIESIDSILPASGTDFWVGYRWSDSNFYFSIQDFNRVNLTEPVWDANHGTEGGLVAPRNPVPDNDWGYDAPYFFQVTVTLHDGEPNP